MFASDRDLLVLDPSVFERVGWVSQRMASGMGSLSVGTLVSDDGGEDFAAKGVGAGSVVLIDGVPHEVISVASAATLVVSRVRDTRGGPALPPLASGSVSYDINTFGPQIAGVHERLVVMVGALEAGVSAGDGTGAVIVNGSELWRLEALGALAQVYAAAATLGGSRSPEWQTASWYLERFEAERRSAVARVDLDGDGEADAARRFTAVNLTRV